MKIGVWILCGAAGAAAAFACSSNDGGGSKANETSCFQQMVATPGSAACNACTDQYCGAQTNEVLSQCSAILDCVCPDGTYLEGQLDYCFNTVNAPNCTTALGDWSGCSPPACDDACAPAYDLDGGPFGDGSDGGPLGDGALTVVSCLQESDGQCTQQEVPSVDAYAAEKDCVQSQHGTEGNGCPTQGLEGCCTDPSSSVETCFYGGDGASDAASDEALCTSTGGGVWHTSP